MYMKKDPLKVEREAMAALARGDKTEAERIVRKAAEEDKEDTRLDIINALNGRYRLA